MPGVLVGGVVHAADMQERHGESRLLQENRHSFHWLCGVFVDNVHACSKPEAELAVLPVRVVEIVRCSNADEGVCVADAAVGGNM